MLTLNYKYCILGFYPFWTVMMSAGIDGASASRHICVSAERIRQIVKLEK